MSTRENAPAERGQHLLERVLEVAAVGPRPRRVVHAGEQLGDESESVVESARVWARHPGQHAELVGQLGGVGEVAVVAEREPGVANRPVDGLRVAPACSSRSSSSGRGRWRGGRRAARAGARRRPG